MSRPKVKESKAFSIRMEKNLYDKLDDFSKLSGQPKTVAVERALQGYLKEKSDLFDDTKDTISK